MGVLSTGGVARRHYRASITIQSSRAYRQLSHGSPGGLLRLGSGGEHRICEVTTDLKRQGSNGPFAENAEGVR